MLRAILFLGLLALVRFQCTGQTSSERIEMITVEGGDFPVTKSKSLSVDSFEMSKYEVTQAQWLSVMGENPSYFKGCDQCPVENVSWNDIQSFIEKLNEKTGGNYRLPTHPEWFYAVRGANKRVGTVYLKGIEYFEENAWCSENSENKTHPVGEQLPNELGLYDLNGNVWEWIADVWPDDYDPETPSTHNRNADRSDKMILGGSFTTSSRDFYMIWYMPQFTGKDDRQPNLGFRLARDL